MLGKTFCVMWTDTMQNTVERESDTKIGRSLPVPNRDVNSFRWYHPDIKATTGCNITSSEGAAIIQKTRRKLSDRSGGEAQKAEAQDEDSIDNFDAGIGP